MAILDRYPQERELFGAVAWPNGPHQAFHVPGLVFTYKKRYRKWP